MSTSKQQDLKDVEPIVWSSNQANTASVNEIENYISDALELYKEENLFGSNLFEMWKIQFENWGTSTTWKVKTAHFKLLREFLRSRNVFIPKFGLHIGQQLSKSLIEGWKQMPDDQMPDVEMTYRPVEYQKGTDVYERPTFVTKDKCREDIKQSNISHAWTNLVKIYSDDDKYAGNANESLELKIRIFNGNCELAGISLEDRNKAVRVMLKGAALSHYYTICKENEPRPSVDTICESLKTHFEGSEHKSATLARWNAVSLYKIIEVQEDKEDIEKAFRSLVTNLENLQPMLYNELQNDIYLQDKILTSCRVHPACTMACSQPANSSSELISRLYTSIATWKSQQEHISQQQNNNYITERVYKGGQNHFLNSHTNNSYGNSRRITNSNYKNQFNNQNPRRKRCFVCDKEECWSTNHSKNEQENAKRRHRERFNRSKNSRRQYITESEFDKEYEQYLLFFEGISPEDEKQYNDHSLDYDDDYQAFLNENTSDINTPVTYHTECGNITEPEASLMLQQLLNFSTKHAITKQETIDIVDENQRIDCNQNSLSETFLIQNHYDSNKFQGIIIDTAASQYSTAGYPQYQAFVKTFWSCKY